MTVETFGWVRTAMNISAIFAVKQVAKVRIMHPAQQKQPKATFQTADSLKFFLNHEREP